MNLSVRFSFLAVFLVACAPPAERSRTSSVNALAHRVDSLVAPLVAANEFSGAIVLMRGGHTIFARGSGLANHSEGVAFTPDTPVDAASVAKTFTAAAIWWLENEGKLSLDTSVQRYLPEYPHRQTTVGQLLAHSNGLPPNYEFFDAHFGPHEVWTTVAMLRIVGEQALQPSFAPGAQYEYSNLGYDAAALVVERVTGQSYEAFVQERFFSRLGLQSSFARPARFSDWVGVRTPGYRWHNGAWELNDAIDREGFYGASNLYLSAADLAHWGSAHASGAALPAPVFQAGQQLLSAGGHPLPLTGLSWHCDERRVRCNYSGHHVGFHSFVYWDRERDVSAAFVSNSSLPPWKIASLQRELVNALNNDPADTDRATTFLDLLGPDATDIAGRYAAVGSADVTLRSVPGGGVLVRVGDDLEYNAYPASQQVLYVPGLDFLVAFSADGETRVMHVKAQELNLVMRRVAKNP